MLIDLLHDANPWWRDRATERSRSQSHSRKHLREIVSALAIGERAVALVGPRQVGKTVLLKQAVEVLLNLRADPAGGGPTGIPPQNITYFSFDDDRIATDLSPRDVVDAKPHGLDESLPRFFLFDEISRAQKWDAWLKQAVDRTRHGAHPLAHRFTVSDSASSLLAKGRVESGLGRWDELEVEPWTFREFLSLDPDVPPEDAMRRDPGAFDRYLIRGGFPAHALSKAPPEVVRERLRADIVDVAIYKDLARQRINTDLARRFFVYLAQESGTEQKLTARSLDLGVDKRSLESWLELLQTAGLIRRLDRLAASQKASSRLRPISRYFAADHGLVSALSFHHGAPPATNPRLLETVVFRHLREVTRSTGARLSYFRDARLECDFVLETDDLAIAVEVSTADPRKHGKLKRLHETADRIGADRSVVIHAGIEETESSGIQLLPLHRFLLDPGTILHRPETGS